MMLYQFTYHNMHDLDEETAMLHIENFIAEEAWNQGWTHGYELRMLSMDRGTLYFEVHGDYRYNTEAQ